MHQRFANNLTIQFVRGLANNLTLAGADGPPFRILLVSAPRCVERKLKETFLREKLPIVLAALAHRTIGLVLKLQLIQSNRMPKVPFAILRQQSDALLRVFGRMVVFAERCIHGTVKRKQSS
jgi:hypothetical protein